MNPEDGGFQAARKGNDGSLRNGAVLGKKGILGCAVALELKWEQGAHWDLVMDGGGQAWVRSPIPVPSQGEWDQGWRDSWFAGAFPGQQLYQDAVLR